MFENYVQSVTSSELSTHVRCLGILLLCCEMVIPFSLSRWMLYHVLFAVGQNVTIMSMCIVELASQFLWQFVMKIFFFDDFFVFQKCWSSPVYISNIFYISYIHLILCSYGISMFYIIQRTYINNCKVHCSFRELPLTIIIYYISLWL